MPPMLACHAHHLYKLSTHATHATHASAPPTLARYPHNHATHTIYASTPPKSLTLALPACICLVVLHLRY